MALEVKTDVRIYKLPNVVVQTLKSWLTQEQLVLTEPISAEAAFTFGT